MQFGLSNRQEFSEPFLSIDEDGELIRLASPRTSDLADIDARVEVLVSKFKEKQKEEPDLGVALTVEELCPGGLDPTDGILIAQALEKAGAKFIIASGGTSDFPALKFRKETKISKEVNNFAWLASACWLIGRVGIPVYAQGNFKLENQAALINQAKACGLSGLIRV